MSDPVRWLDAEVSALETERDLLRAAPPADPPDGAQEQVWAAMAAQLGLAGTVALGGVQGAGGGALSANAGGAASAAAGGAGEVAAAASAGEVAAAASAGKVASAAGFGAAGAVGAGAGAAGAASAAAAVAAAAGAAGIVKSMLLGAACGVLFLVSYAVVAPPSAAPPAQVVEVAPVVAPPASAPAAAPAQKTAAYAEAAPPAEARPPTEAAQPAEAPVPVQEAPPVAVPLPARRIAPARPRTTAAPPKPEAPQQEHAASAPPADEAEVAEAAPAVESAGAALVDGAPSPAALRESRLREELTLLADARAALRRGNAAGALMIAERARLRFPGGALAQEREALTIEALWHSGQRAAAAQRASAFLRAYPSSPHVSRLHSFTH
ncbi:hypothetical protein WME75_26695 [Sorangium sp. So ce1014]|uniref:hypothetical protein n=1 Tax=Sorangium sp. So ce1014 TaxID=3133326 RepID=UPI003F642BE1